MNWKPVRLIAIVGAILILVELAWVLHRRHDAAAGQEDDSRRGP